MVAPTYVWITPGWYTPLWWAKSTNSSCQSYIMREALNHSLSVIPDGYLITKNSSVSPLVSRVQLLILVATLDDILLVIRHTQHSATNL